MSEQEKSGGGAGSSVVLVDQTVVSKQSKQLFRPIDMQEDATHEQLHKRSKAPAVPSVTEDLRDSKPKDETESDIANEKLKQTVSKKQSRSRRTPSPEKLTTLPLTGESKPPAVVIPQLVPTQIIVKQGSEQSTEIVQEEQKKDENDSITGETIELRNKEELQRASEWSDEEEAGGLPRSESRSSRVLGAVRQLFCCGTLVEPPSEHRISPRTYYEGI